MKCVIPGSFFAATGPCAAFAVSIEASSAPSLHRLRGRAISSVNGRASACPGSGHRAECGVTVCRLRSTSSREGTGMRREFACFSGGGDFSSASAISAPVNCSCRGPGDDIPPHCRQRLAGVGRSFDDYPLRARPIGRFQRWFEDRSSGQPAAPCSVSFRSRLLDGTHLPLGGSSPVSSAANSFNTFSARALKTPRRAGTFGVILSRHDLRSPAFAAFKVRSLSCPVSGYPTPQGGASPDRPIIAQSSIYIVIRY